MNKKGYGIIIIMVVAVLVVGGIIGYVIQKDKTDKVVPEEETMGSVGNLPYRATTTPEDLTWTDQLLDTGAGVLGSVVITTSGDLAFDLLKATTTNDNLRTTSVATSSILLASFPADTAVGTYTFDVSYSNGLYLDVKSGTLCTSTITYK